MNCLQRVIHVVALVVIGACAPVLPALAQGCPELVSKPTGRFSAAVAVSGSYAYLLGSYGLIIADVSDPPVPEVVGGLGHLTNANAMVVSGGYAYVASSRWSSRWKESGWTGLLSVIDVKMPSKPVEVGFVDMLGSAQGVAVAGRYAYVVGSGGLGVIDVSTPAAPKEVGSLSMGGGWRDDVAVSGGYAYVPDGFAGLRVIDVSVPSAPVEVGLVDTPGSAGGVAVSGRYAYVVDHYSLRVIDVSTPSAPVEVGFVDTYRSAYDVAVSGGYAYVADDTDGLRVIDVSTPSSPVEVGSVATPGCTSSVAVQARL